MTTRKRSCAILLALALLLSGVGTARGEEVQFVKEFLTFKQLAELPMRSWSKKKAWQQVAPHVVEVSIPRRSGGAPQPALWYHAGTKKKKPLLLVLHSWSADYLEHDGIPYGVFARRNDWIFIHPNFRGRFNKPAATGSEQAVQDVLEALRYAKERAPVDEERIFLAGFSGGAMMTLIMVGRYPEKFTAAVAWVPVYNLNDWYQNVSVSSQDYARHYRMDIEASCGGKPDTNDKARRECFRRSPAAYLSNARGRGVRLFISGGIHDHFVPPSQAIRAFNDLAAPADKISETDYRQLDATEALPAGLAGQSKQSRFFAEAGLPVVFARTSRETTLVLFDGGHNSVYNAGFKWLSWQRRRASGAPQSAPERPAAAGALAQPDLARPAGLGLRPFPRSSAGARRASEDPGPAPGS